MTLEDDFYEKKVFNDQQVFEEMLTSAGISYSYDPRWNAILVKSKTHEASVCFLFDENGNMYSLPDEKVKEWKSDHPAKTQRRAEPSPQLRTNYASALGVTIDEVTGKHYYEYEEESPEPKT